MICENSKDRLRCLCGKRPPKENNKVRREQNIVTRVDDDGRRRAHLARERRGGVMPKESTRLRDLAAGSLRAGRATSDPFLRQTCFGVAAAYKRFALGAELAEGATLRSQGRPSLERRPRVSGLGPV
jgi:hypothetical protein